LINKVLIDDIAENPIILGHILGYDKLMKHHNDWIKKCWLSDTDVTLQAYRNSKKTTSILVVGTIWRLLYFPDTLIAIIRKSETGAISILQEITRHYLSEKLKYIYSEVFNTPFELTDWNQKRINLPTKVRISKEFNIEAYGKGGNITGAHFDKICIDDIVTEKDRYSPAERESTKNYIRELSNIKTVGGTIIATGTPWHRDDAFTILPEPRKYPIGSVDDPDFTPEIIAELRKTNGNSLYAANYLLQHIADSDQLIEPKFKAWDEKLTCSAYLDPAYSGDCTTALTLLEENPDKTITIKGFVWRENITNLYQKIVDICSQYNCIMLYCEANGDHGLSHGEINKRFPLTRAINEKENKHYKITHWIHKLSPRLFFADDCQPEYLEQIVYYQEGGGLIDAPDSLASILRELYKSEGGMFVKAVNINTRMKL
jgi:hypothetical protein